MLIGYARASTQGQNLDLQREAVTKPGSQTPFADKRNDSQTERPGLSKMLDVVREGKPWSFGRSILSAAA